jgi:hypothetical protein
VVSNLVWSRSLSMEGVGAGRARSGSATTYHADECTGQVPRHLLHKGNVTSFGIEHDKGWPLGRQVAAAPSDLCLLRALAWWPSLRQ